MKKTPWIVFVSLLLFAIAYVVRTVPQLPPLVASHFNGAGHPNAYMTREFYAKFTLAFGVGLPVASAPGSARSWWRWCVIRTGSFLPRIAACRRIFPNS